jgi:hypothetical protein
MLSAPVLAGIVTESGLVLMAGAVRHPQATD